MSDPSKAIQTLLEENERLKTELEMAKKEIFELKQENVELKKEGKTNGLKSSNNFAKLTCLSSFEQNGQHENSKIEKDEIVCSNCNNSIGKQNYKLHVIY
jgi:predicted RNase H-like nuclease (RuvC/YqgF family)